MSSQPASEGLQRADQGCACRCQRAGVGEQLDEPFERPGRPALVGLWRVHRCIDRREMDTGLARRGSA